MRRLALEQMGMVTFILLIMTLSIQVTFAQSSIPVSRDGDVLSRFHAINQMEIKMGSLAKAHGSTPEIRRFGDRLIRDHQLADKRVVDAAKRLELSLLPPVPKSRQERIQMQKDQAHMKSLESAAGNPAFDEQFLLLMEQGHRQAVQMLKEEKDKLAETSLVRDVILKWIPILEQHFDLAIHIEQKGSKA